MGGWGQSYPNFFGILLIFYIYKAPKSKETTCGHVYFKVSAVHKLFVHYLCDQHVKLVRNTNIRKGIVKEEY